MATIVIHAGMPKAGSSTIQQWLRHNAGRLGKRNMTVVVASGDPESPSFSPYEGGSINSGWLVDRAIERIQAGDETAAATGLAAGLSQAAELHGDVVVTGESLAHPFWSLHQPTLYALEQLAQAHEVRIAYYVRPQHTALESAWRQWGFRSLDSPSVYVRAYAERLHHASTVEGVANLAPSLDFGLRPVSEEQSDGHDLVADFAGRFLDVEARSEGKRANPGLPLELAILLRAAPLGMFWRTTDDNVGLNQIKRLLPGLHVPNDRRIDHSRQILHRYAYERFAEENATLDLSALIPKPAQSSVTLRLDELDLLWRPSASPAELAIFFSVLTSAISPPRANASG